MKKLSIFTINLIVAVHLNLYSQEIDSLTYPSKTFYGEKFFDKFYLHTNFEHFLDNLHDFSIQQIETAGDYSQPAPYTFSIMGGSYKWNQFYYNDFKINDPYFPGSAIHKPFLFDNNVDIDFINSSINFTPSSSVQKALIQWNNGNLGDRLWNADYLINTITGHVSPYQRLYGTPIEYRKRVNGNLLLMLHNIIEHRNGNLYQSIYFNAGEHMLTTFDYKGINAYFPENYLQLHIDGNLPLIAEKLFDFNGYIFSYQERDQLFSEYFYGENETAKLKSFDLSLYAKKYNKFTTGFNLSFKNIQHNVPNFSRNFIDIDGEGIEPWYADEKIIAFSYYHKQEKKLNDLFSFKAELYDGLMSFNPYKQTSFNTTYFQSTDSNYHSLYYTEWQYNSFVTALLQNSASIELHHSNLSGTIAIKANAGISLDGFSVNTNTFIKPGWQFTMDLDFKLSSFASLSVFMGKKQLPFDADYLRFFSADYMNGKMYYWQDLNGDKEFQPAEKAAYFTSTGGKYHHLSDGLQQPYEIYLEIPITLRAGKRSLFTLSGCYRQFRELWGITYDKSAASYGYYTQPENVSIYSTDPVYRQIYFLNNTEVNYIAVNNYEALIKEGAGKTSFLRENPYYEGWTFKYEYRGRKLYLSASITAYNLVGFGSMGNGVLHNNLSVLSETMANPNSYIYYLGRLDADRSYIGRLLVSYAVNRHLTMAFQYKYKDGQAFNSFGVKNISDNAGNTQIAFWNNNVKGDDPYSGETSRREDCFYNTELKCKYSIFFDKKVLDINLSVYNLFDLGFQLAEDTFPPATNEGSRKAIDIQIPRGFILSAALKL
ncbi:MAG: hypothetical protein ACOYO1_08465 [Bacteroidales bacterium]